MVKTKQNKNMVACLKKMRIYQITESMDILLPHPDPLSTLLCAWKASLNGPHQFSPLLSGLGLWGIPSGGWKMGAEWDQSIYSPNPLPAAALEAGGTADPFLSSGPCQILPPLAPFDLLLLFSSSVVPDSLQPHGPQHAGFPVLHHPPEPAQTHVHWVNDTTQASHPLLLCCPLLLLPSIFPSIRVFSTESALCIRWPKYWSFSLSISPSNEYSAFISFRIDWFDLLAVQGTLGEDSESSPTPQFNSSVFNSSAFSLLYGPTLTPIHDYWKNHSFD